MAMISSSSTPQSGVGLRCLTAGLAFECDGGAGRRVPNVWPAPQFFVDWVPSLTTSFPFLGPGGESPLLDRVFPVPVKFVDSFSGMDLGLG